MRLDIKVTPGAKRTLVKEEGGVLKVYVTAKAVDGKANQALIEVLAVHFGVRKNRIEIIKGLKNRNKTINIEGI